MRVLLTGPPGCGKTTAVLRVVDGLQETDRRLRGLVTEEIREDGRRVGFSILGLHGGGRGIMAHVDLEEGPRVSRYRVDVGAIDRIVGAELGEVPEGSVVVIDEIGKMECFSDRFVDAVRRVARSSADVVATIPARAGGTAGELVAALRRTPGWDVVELDPDNRDAVPGHLLERLVEARSGR